VRQEWVRAILGHIMNPLLRIRYLFEYLCLRLLWALLRALPPSHAFALGAKLGGLWFRFSKRRRGVAIDNLLQTGIASTRQEARRIALASFRHFVGHLVELPRIPDIITAENDTEHVELEFTPSALELLQAKEKPVMLVSGHLGCWETAAYWVSLTRPIYAMVRPMDNPYVDRFMTQSHFRKNVRTLPKMNGVTPEMIAGWRRDRAAFAILMDQHAGHGGLWMNVMGRPASVHKSPARLHFLTGFPVILGAFVRVGPFRFRAIMDGPVEVEATGNREQDTRAMVEALNSRLEALIRRYPEQYLWMHRRWRTPPADVVIPPAAV